MPTRMSCLPSLALAPFEHPQSSSISVAHVPYSFCLFPLRHPGRATPASLLPIARLVRSQPPRPRTQNGRCRLVFLPSPTTDPPFHMFSLLLLAPSVSSLPVALSPA